MKRLLALALLIVAGCSSSARPRAQLTRAVGPYSTAIQNVGGLRVPARASATTLQLATTSGFSDRFWPGVNLGSTTPGSLPGELNLPRATLDRWLSEMGTFGVRVVRVYTILPPAFYDALSAYDSAHRDAPIWFIQGVWIPEDDFYAHHDMYRPSFVDAFRHEIANAVGVVHGDANIPAMPGHASGVYRSDVSQWLLAWSPGIEWDPVATHDSDVRNAHVAPYHGTYITTRATPTPTESFLASTLDYLASLEVKRGWSRPLTFTNWLTADPLSHPEEPLPQEGLISIDAMHLQATPKWPGGFFASYHAYPYYPEFLRLSKQYAAYKVDGRSDAYAGYLHALRAHHGGQAVMITEFGVPDGLGLAHRGPDGRDQGGHSEADEMRIDAGMLQDIKDEGFAGGMTFEWADEWFKHTWNTQDYEVPDDRRQLWNNVYTNEEHFGILAEDASAPIATQRIFETSQGAIRAVDASKDESYLLLKLTFAQANDWIHHSITIGFDTAPRAGNDEQLTIGPGTHAQLLQRAALNPLLSQYGDTNSGLGYVHSVANGDAWVAPSLMVDRPFVEPDTHQQFAVDTHDISVLPWGSDDPNVAGSDTRNLIDGSGTTIEVRVPWMLLGYADPSSHLVLIPHGSAFSTVKTGRVGIDVQTDGRVIHTSGFDWDDWNVVHAQERLKVGSNVLSATFASLARA